MKKDSIINNLPEGTFSRQQIYRVANTIDPSFKKTQLRYLIGSLRDSGLIVREGHNQYRASKKEPKKPYFVGKYSSTALKTIAYMNDRFPLLSFRVWELSWLNEFFNHLIAHNRIYLEIEKDGVEYIFSTLIDVFPGKVLLKPRVQDVMNYATDDGIIINRLITESPKSKEEPYQVPLEKLIVDLFANKNLMLFEGEYPAAIGMMFSKYQIDQVSMFRYARRRNKEKDLIEFLREKTEVELRNLR